MSSVPWLSGWKYRRPITIDNSKNTNNLTDYQISITIDTATLIATGKMRSDGGDIRFTDSDGVTLLSYWIESGINTNSTTIWVKVPSIPASSTKTIYLYYGNPTAISLSNGNNVFLFFDDFEDGVVDTTKWVKGNGTIQETGGELNVQGVAILPAFVGIRTNTFTINPTTDRVVIEIVGYKRVQGSYTRDWFQQIRVLYDDNNYFDLDADGQSTYKWRMGGKIGGSYIGYTSSYTWSFGTRYRLKVIVNAGNFSGYVDNNQIWSSTYSVNKPHKIGFEKMDGLPATGYDLNEWMQAFFVRKYTSPEPTLSLLGEYYNPGMFWWEEGTDFRETKFKP